MSARAQIATYWAVAAILVSASLALGPWRGVAWVLLGALAAGAAIVGARVNRASRRWPWLVLAGAMIVSAASDELLPGSPATDTVELVTAANLVYFASFVAATGALLRFGRSETNGAAPAGLLDTLMVTVLLFLLVWVAAIRPAGLDPERLGDPSLVAYPIGSALLVATAARLVLTGPRTPAAVLLLAGAGFTFAADLAMSLVQSGQFGSIPWFTDLGWLLSYACWGAAALHPSMAGLTETKPARAQPLSLRRFWVVAVCALVAPGVLLVEASQGQVRDGPVLALTGALLTLLALARVATTANVQSRSLAFREQYDTLTGLASRAYLVRRLALEPAAPWRTVALVNLDQFRLVNDDAGHSVGDEILVAVARRLVREVARDDLVARFGGDEFAVLVRTPRDPTALTADLIKATSTPVVVGGRAIAISASIGVAVAPPPATMADPGNDAPDDGAPDDRATITGADLLRRAGLALQAAKAAGPGEWCRYDSDRHELLIQRVRLRESLARAVTDNAFRLLYQPIVELRTGVTVGFEALVRWEHPTRGLVPPSAFIALAEETGLIEAIGDLVLRTAVAEAVDWSKSGSRDVYVSVNVSARQLRHPGFTERVEEVLAAAGLPAGRLMLELTESVLTRESDRVWEELASLRDLGVRLAIDDFGTGFSSLSYLEQTPIDVIKMDKSFVDSLVPSGRQRTVVEGILQMAGKLGLQIVAEGIESTDERDLLAELECPYGQGYLFSAPIGGAEAISWLAQPPLPAPRQAPPAD